MTAQLERLKQDVTELELYINKLQRKGKLDLVSKLSEKRKFLKNHLAEFQQQAMQ
jgi:hypothetical protein